MAFTDEQIKEILNAVFAQQHTQYIGARYVPLFGRKGEETVEWDNKAPYEPLTVVLHEGNSFTSRQYVPAGIDISNKTYWAETGNFNAQVEQYRREALHAKNTADTAITLANKHTGYFTNLGINSDSSALEAKTHIDSAYELSNKTIGYFGNLGINSDSSALEMKNHVDSAVENSDDSIAYFREMKINSIETAGINYRANAMDIRKIGAIEGDESIDCGALINTYLYANPNAAIYVPNGVWYTKSTVSIEGESTIWCDGFLKLATEFTLTDDTIVKLHGSDSMESSTMRKGKTIKVNVDGNGESVNGISVQGYFASTFDLTANGCMKTCIKTISRNIENYFNIHFYGTANAFAEVGFATAEGDNDNRADVIGRNASKLIDNHASYWFYGYVHVWGGDVAFQLYKSTYTVIDQFYPDYADGFACSDAPSAVVYVNQIVAIMPDEYHLIAEDNKIYLNAGYVYLPNGYKTFSATSLKAAIGNFWVSHFNKDIVIEVDIDDLNSFTTLEQFTEKYGFIDSQSLLPGVTIKFPNSPSPYKHDTFVTTQYGKNLKLLQYYISADNEFSVGQSTVYITKRIINRKYPQEVNFEILQNDCLHQQIVGKINTTAPNMGTAVITYTKTTKNL